MKKLLTLSLFAAILFSCKSNNANNAANNQAADETVAEEAVATPAPEENPMPEAIALTQEQFDLMEFAFSGRANGDALNASREELKTRIEAFVEKNGGYRLTDEDRNQIYDMTVAFAKRIGENPGEEEMNNLKNQLQSLNTLADLFAN